MMNNGRVASNHAQPLPGVAEGTSGTEQSPSDYYPNQQVTNQGFHGSGGMSGASKAVMVDLNKIVTDSKERMTSMRIPKKQGRMFQLNLGQDNGPFKQKQINGCPQVDKFATYSLNSIVNNKTSPRIGILGASTFPSEHDFSGSQIGMQASKGMGDSNIASGTRIDDVSLSVNQQIKQLEDQLVTGYDMLQIFKEEADQIRKEIDIMMNILVEKTEVVQDELHVETRKDYHMLKADIKAQRDENEILYKNLKKIVQETSSQKNKIQVYQAKIEELEQHVGIIGNSPDPYFTIGSPNAYNNKSKGMSEEDADRQPADISALGGMKSGEGLWDPEDVQKGLDLTSNNKVGVMSNDPIPKAQQETKTSMQAGKGNMGINSD